MTAWQACPECKVEIPKQHFASHWCPVREGKGLVTAPPLPTPTEPTEGTT